MQKSIVTKAADFFRNNPKWTLLCLLTITFIPFLGETLFNTKGEPREAIVAVSMLQQGDWILPLSNGGDMPYKPPMLAWCIAIVSLFTGGEVTEFTSRFPSALAMVVMTFVSYLVASKHTSKSKAFMMAVVTMTAFEVHRAAYACRVDMLLTCFIVLALFVLYHNYQRDGKIISPAVMLLMSGAVLTKGPVGMLLPAMVAWVYIMFRGGKFWRTSLHMAANCMASLILPALWYIAAAQQGGQGFLDLVYEENIGRFAGTMSYESHLNPWYYNIITIVAGFAPLTLVLLVSLFGLKYSKPTSTGKLTPISRHFETLRKCDSWTLFNALTVVLIFIFYCIPASKRSVYLLPIYPSLAFFIADYLHYLFNRQPQTLKFFASFIAILAPLMAVLTIVLKIAKPSFGGRSMSMFIEAFHSGIPGFMAILAILVSLYASYKTWRAIARADAEKALKHSFVALLTVYWSFSAFYQPTVLNVKSDKPVAEWLENNGFGPKNKLYGYVDSDMMRYYTINFYLGDGVINFDKATPESGTLIIGEKDLDAWEHRFAGIYDFSLVYDTGHQSCDTKQNILILNFSKKR